MSYEIIDDYVLKVQEIQTPNQIAIVKSFYDMLLHTKLEYSNGNIYASVYNYLEELQTDFTNPIIFECEGVTEEIEPVEGVARLPIEVEEGITVTVRTINPNMRNGEVIVIG